jgi:hypothetical protein
LISTSCLGIDKTWRARCGQVHVVDEIVLVPPLGSAMMRAGNMYGKNCSLVNTNTRLVVGWYGDLAARPGPRADAKRGEPAAKGHKR